jgi:hypothetical protein
MCRWLVAGHQPHPRRLAPREPPDGSLRRPAPREPPAGSLRCTTPQEPLAGPLRHPAMLVTLRPSAARPHHTKPQERPPISVGWLKCPANKNNNKIYQIKQ